MKRSSESPVAPKPKRKKPNNENRRPKIKEEVVEDEEDEEEKGRFEVRGGYVYFGKNLRTRVPKKEWQTIVFGKGHTKKAMRTLLVSCYGIETLATSSATGRPSPAFPGKAAKKP